MDTDSIKQRWMSPNGKIARSINVLVIILCAMMALAVFFWIHFFLCGQDACATLKLSKIFYDLSAFYLVYAVSALIVALHIARHKTLQRIYSEAITLAIACGVVLIIVAPFVISRELQ